MVRPSRADETRSRPVAVITGASRGIGAATAQLFARRGYDLVLASRSELELQKVASSPELNGICCHVVPTDVRRESDLEELARVVSTHFGFADVLIHNAGVVRPGPDVANLSNELVFDLVRTNLLAPIELTRHLLPSMIGRRRGFIGFVDSLGGHIGLPRAALYSATKFGLRGFAMALRREVAAHGIKVSIITPGLVATNLVDANMRAVIKKYRLPMIEPEDVAEVIIRAVDGAPREIIFPYLYRFLVYLERNLPMALDILFSRLSREPKNGIGERDD